jgi:hypothetical protein
MKCKICRKEIDPPEVLIGERPEDRDKRIISRLLRHLQKRAEIEKAGGGPHLEAIQHAAATCMHISGNLNGALLTGNFELPAELEKQRLELLRQVHEMTRQVRLSDEDLKALYNAYCNGAVRYPTSLSLLKDIRDRYESLGLYAPAQPAPAAQPEEVKQ